MNNLNTKQEYRKIYLEKRKSLTRDAVIRSSKLIIEKIHVLDIYKNAKIIAIYYPFNNEISLLDLAKEEKMICFPKVISYTQSKMEFYELGLKTSSSLFGMQEPTGKHITKDEIDLFLVPGIVFSRKGERIGYGKGFYDQFLRNVNVPKVGIAYAFQVVDELPKSSTDVLLDKIITEEEVICIQRLL